VPDLRAHLPRIALALLLLSVVIASHRRLLETARLSVAMARIGSWDERRATLFGDWYRDVLTLRRSIPPHEAVDFVMTKPPARDIAVLAGAELGPRDVRFFDGWDAWRARKRADFLHDARAANAIPAPPPSVARYVVAVDPDARPRLKLVAP
jgi:hypothetical protein